ncbi:MAG: hypothetical protein KatS3mg031_2475 [Chitinophagales bacterium]|nr:MAG: hypothetical protein KatS3mg031_2475 [Chitinophagales bacterium]
MRTKNCHTGADFVCTIAPPKLDYLRELSGGDAGFMKEIIEMFILEAPRALEQAQACLLEKNLEQLRMIVHKLKSSVQVVGGQHLTDLIVRIESWSGETNEELCRMVQMLEEGIQDMIGHLQQELIALT